MLFIVEAEVLWHTVHYKKIQVKNVHPTTTVADLAKLRGQALKSVLLHGALP